MKIKAVALLTLIHQASAFAPTAFTSRSNTFKHSAIVDPSFFHDAPQHIDTLSNIFSSINLADADLNAAADTVTAAAAAIDPTPIVEAAPAAVQQAVADVAPAAAEIATEAAKPDNGWFGFLAGPIAFSLELIHGALTGVGVDANAWGLAIIIMTTTIKLLTYPLTAAQLESTVKMQAVSPLIKEVQAKYQSNPEVMNQKIAALYQENNVNPLAGCIPSLVQLPVFIGLYRALNNLAADDKLNEPFLWLPNLEGPVYGADPSSANSWLFSGWVDGVPSLGWDDTLAFLTIPVILVVSQSISMNLMASKDQEQPAFIKFLPLLIGFFSINVPAALGIYWVANNFITTALTLQIKSNIKPMTPVSGGSSAASAGVVDVQPTTFTPAPMREKPAGFGASDWSDGEDTIKPITPVDAEIESSETMEATPVVESSAPKNKKRGGKKKKKKRN